MYETLDADNPADYTFPEPSPVSKCSQDANGYAYIPTKAGEDTEALYHAVGPNVFGSGVGSGTSTAVPPPVPSRNGNGYIPLGSNGLHHLLGSAVGDVAVHYEDPTLPQFRVC